MDSPLYVCPKDSSCLMSKHRLTKCPPNQTCHAAMWICKCCCQFDSVLQLWAICITGYWACSSFKQVRTFPSCCVSHLGIIQIRLLHKRPPFYWGCTRVKSGKSVFDFAKRDQKATRQIHSLSRNASAILLNRWNPRFNEARVRGEWRRARQGERQNVGYPRGRRLLPQERPVLNKSFNFHAQLPYLPLIQCGSE